MPNDWQEELDRNYAWFLGQLSKLLTPNQGRYALIYRQALVGVFDRPGDAEREAEARFTGQPYSIQPIEAQVVDMGYFSHALH